ncbi:uncharacterized protein H6S33_011521 [Morchella sextelata]|uniref:uncharacterized protein n=1 Tax=Morchella sextelata TaxID=1174677 RepID=UPI001D0383DC|nr:uncharacterized protein H6S33_011521 [Morchella sextelata]KAH0611094.1 hypothetical protein H6S33_011521 [Morchella sextelata]
MPKVTRTIEIDSDDFDDDSVPDSEELLTRSTVHKIDNSHNTLADEIAALNDNLEEMFRTCTNNKAELKALNMLQKAAEKRHSAALTDYEKMLTQKQRLEALLLKQKHNAAVTKKEKNSGQKTLKRTRNRSLKSETSNRPGPESKVFLPQNAVKAIKSMPPPSPLKPYRSMPPPSSVKTNRSMPPSTPAKSIRSMLLERAVKASKPMPPPSPATVKAARSAPSPAQVKTDRSTPSPIEVQIKPITQSFHREEYKRLSESPPAKRIKRQESDKKPTPPKATYEQVITEINGDGDSESESPTSISTTRLRLGRPEIIAGRPFDGKIRSGISLARTAYDTGHGIKQEE